MRRSLTSLLHLDRIDLINFLCDCVPSHELAFLLSFICISSVANSLCQENIFLQSARKVWSHWKSTLVTTTGDPDLPRDADQRSIKLFTNLKAHYCLSLRIFHLNRLRLSSLRVSNNNFEASHLSIHFAVR